MAELWTAPADSLLADLEEKVTTQLALPVLSRANVQLLSGTLPPGLRLQDKLIVGTPYEVARKIEYRFVLRATLDQFVRDRAFKITINGPDAPEWQTDPGLLPVGNNNAFYILDNTPIDFQLIAVDEDTEAGQTLEFWIGDGDGQLPPGTELTSDGRIVGIVDPLLAIEKGLLYSAGTYDTVPYDLISGGYDFGVRSSNGFDSFYYDTTVWDFSYTEQPPKKLNRYYQFTVNVSDSDTIARRTFRIFVVGDDFFRADNTVLQVGNGTFTADNTNLRTPIWITPSDLGIKRANNYITIPLDIIDSNSLVGFVSYSLEDTNKDGSPSQLPPGMKLDLSNGEIAGRVPYQAEVTKTYNFTIKATRFTPDQIDENVFSTKQFTLRLLGEINSKTTWITESELGTLSTNIISVLKIEAETNVPNSRILYSVAEGRLPPGLQLTYDGEIVGKVNTYGDNVYKSFWRSSRSYKANDVVKYDNKFYKTNSDHLSNSFGNFLLDSNLWVEFDYSRGGLTVFDNDNFLLDNSETSIDREFRFIANAEDQYKFSIAKKEFLIKVNDPEITKYTNIHMKPFLKQDIRTEFNAFISDPEVFNPEYIYRLNDPNFGLQRDLKMLVYAGIETKEIQYFVQATASNHKRKKYKIGELKSAIANVPGTTDSVYEVVYLEVIDPANPETGRTRKKININNDNKITADISSATPQDVYYDYLEKPSFIINLRGTTQVITLGEDFSIVTRDDGTQKISWEENIIVDSRTENNIIKIVEGLSSVFRPRPDYENVITTDTTLLNASQSKDNIRYISNISNMRDNIRSIGETKRDFVPLWMRSQQPGSVNELGYTPALVLCYCKPGTSEIIMSAIKNRGFDFKKFNLDFDRYIIDSTDIASQPQFILFDNKRYNI